MKRQQSSNDFNPFNQLELIRKTVIHEAGHAASIYFGNKQKQLPPVFFQILIDQFYIESQSPNYLCRSYVDCNNSFTKIEGGRLIHTLPSSFDEAVRDFSLIQKQAYQRAFDADIINLLVGPLAEAHYVAMRDDELINSHLVNLDALPYYGGTADLETINEYLDCLCTDKVRREKKLSGLFREAFDFINDRSNWIAIIALSDYFLADPKRIITCEEIIAVLERHCFFASKNTWC